MAQINIITDNISGVVLADKLEKSFNINLFIPKGCRFNGFLSLKNEKTFSGSRLYELSYTRKNTQYTPLKEFDYKYKSHINFMDFVLDYFDYVNLIPHLKLATSPLLQYENKLIEDFMYGMSLNSIKQIDNNHLIDIKNDLISIEKINGVYSYKEYLSLIKNNDDFVEASVKSTGSKFFQYFYKPLKNKLIGGYDIKSRYHRILWLPLIWTKSLEEVLFKNIYQPSQIFHSISSKYNIPYLILEKIKRKNNIKIVYFDKKSLKIEGNKLFIENEIIQDSESTYFGINLDQYFENLFDFEFVESNFSWISIKKQFLLNDFSQITFVDSELPYRVSYKTFNDEIIICVEHGVIKKNIELLLLKLIELEIFSESILGQYHIINEHTLLNKNIPTKNNFKSATNRIEHIKNLLPKTKFLTPYSFYQSNALNDQIILGLVEAGKKNDRS